MTAAFIMGIAIARSSQRVNYTRHSGHIYEILLRRLGRGKKEFGVGAYGY